MAWALITGASSGLGAQFARLAAADGWNVVLAARRVEAMEALAANLNVETVVIAADLSQPGAADALWAQANDGRNIDLLVNNAGLGAHGSLGDGENTRERDSIAVNVTAYTQLMQNAVADFRTRRVKGQILNVASLAGYLPGPNMAVYHATKAYALSLSRAVHEEVKAEGITVTALCPGTTRTEFFKSASVKQTWNMRLMPMGTSAKVAATGWRALKSGKRQVVAGGLNKTTAVCTRFLPPAVLGPMTKFLLTKNQ